MSQLAGFPHNAANQQNQATIDSDLLGLLVDGSAAWMVTTARDHWLNDLRLTMIPADATGKVNNHVSILLLWFRN